MAVISGRVPVAEINARAREASFGRMLLTVLAAVLYGAGWLVGKTLALMWLAVAWSAVAVKVGFNEGRGAGRGEQGRAGGPA